MDELRALILKLETVPGHAIRVASHETPHTASGWAPEQTKQLVLLAPASDLLAVLEAFRREEP